MTIYHPISCPQSKRQREGPRQEAVWPWSKARTSSQIYPPGGVTSENGEKCDDGTQVAGGKQVFLGCMLRELKAVPGLKHNAFRG